MRRVTEAVRKKRRKSAVVVFERDGVYCTYCVSILCFSQLPPRVNTRQNGTEAV